MIRRFPPGGNPARRGERRAFSLVEVVLAIGLVGFVLSVVLGLVAMAANTNREADLRERQALISGRLVSSYQSQPFAAVKAALPETHFFDHSGIPAASAAERYFRCVVRDVTPAGTPENLAILQLGISWPEPQPASSHDSLFSIVNYR